MSETPHGTAPGRARPASAANRLGLDYRAEASRFLPIPLIDIHTHINGPGAARVYADVARLYGVRLTYSQTDPGQVDAVKEVLGDRVRFVAVASFRDPDRARAWREGFLENIERFARQHGSRILKFWSAPRLREMFPGEAGADLVEPDSPWRVRAAELAQSLGMMFMTHVGDPDTWFRARYTDPARFLRKSDHYRGFEVMLDRFPAPWIAAHMGGWPEDLGFLDGLLTRHPNLYLDTSATKWIAREMSKHEPSRVVEFMQRWRGRILFGSDIVTLEEHLSKKPEPLGGEEPGKSKHPMGDLASSPEEAFELYASRYWAQRTMWETGYDGESPIADPDLMMVEPDRYDAMSAPRLRGFDLPRDLLEILYHSAAEQVLAKVGERP